MTICAVLIETVSIQKYVFGSNKLKENLGASWLIQQIYEKYLKDSVKKILPSVKDNVFDEWRKSPKVIQINNGAEFEVGYIGGGNAFLLFNDNEKSKKFIKDWTKELLVNAPGIITAVAIDTFDLDPNDLDPNKFQAENQKLFKKLQENKYKHIPQTVIPRHGITAECSHTGYSMDIWNDKAPATDKQEYISSVAYAKICVSKEATEKLENEEFKDELKDELKAEYCFTDELNKLGQQKGEDSHIAIVHIDGNGMGERFQKTVSLEEIRKLSNSVELATKNSFRLLLKEIINNFPKIEKFFGYDSTKKWPEENGKKILPIRPIIIGGDDITFVCEGKLGIYFAKIFMEAFEKQKDIEGNELAITSCAGVAITKTKYPFYRGYELAEQLCGNAKKIRKEQKNPKGSWLDFHISYGGFSGTIEEIRESHYISPQGNLLFRPYKINSTEERGIEILIKNTIDLKDIKNKFSTSRIKELRKVLTLGEEAIKTFVNELKARGLKLPEIKGKQYHIDIFQKLTGDFVTTPYFDMIEFMELYPSFLLEVKNEES